MEHKFFVGVDWATEEHEVCILDPQATVVERLKVEHAGAAIAAFASRLSELAKGNHGHVAVAIETPRGSLVEGLIERGFLVFAINPKQLDRFRDRHTVAGAKDDRRDAFVLADSLRTDQHLFRRIELDAPLVIQLREQMRAYEDLRQEANRLTNRLREQLHRFYPQVLKLSPSANEAWLWSLLDLAPTPDAGEKLRPSQVTDLLLAHRIRRLTAQHVVDALRTEPLQVAPGVVEAATAHIRFLMPRLRLVRDLRLKAFTRIKSVLDEMAATEPGGPQPSDVQIIRSVPGVGPLITATLLAEASHPIGQRDFAALRAHSGVAPVTRASGKRSKRPIISMRHACNGRLRNALYHCARVATQHDPSAKAYYLDARKRGQSHGRALRGVADRLLRILVAMLKTRTLYDPDQLVGSRSGVADRPD